THFGTSDAPVSGHRTPTLTFTSRRGRPDRLAQLSKVDSRLALGPARSPEDAPDHQGAVLVHSGRSQVAEQPERPGGGYLGPADGLRRAWSDENVPVDHGPG